MEWYLMVLKNYAGFEGRACRKEYWMFFLFNFLFSFAIGFVEGIFDLPKFLSAIYTLIVLVPGIAVGVRRLHDTGRSGWWLLISLVPLIGAIVLLVFLCEDGKEKENQYGTNPKVGLGM